MRNDSEDRAMLKFTADTLFNYLRDVIYNPAKASLKGEDLPEEFQNFGKGLQFYNELVGEMISLAKELAKGNLDCKLPPPGNEIAAPMKMLHSSLKHLTWQAQQVANGDYRQRIDFMGDFSKNFNNMVVQLEKKHRINQEEKFRLERYVHLMLANCPDPVLLFDNQGNVVYVSESYLQIDKKSSAEGTYGRNIKDLLSSVISEESLHNIENIFEKVIKEKQTIKTDQDISFSNDNAIRHYQIQVAPMLDVVENLEGIMMILYDMTEIVNAREEAERARTLAERASQAKTNFLAAMSHEMRTPMNAIIGMTNIFKESSNPEQKDYCIDKISQASQHLLGVINDVLDMSRIEADKFELSYGICNFEKMIEQVAEFIMFRVEERHQQLTVQVDPHISKNVITDGQRVSQVLVNLLTNAVKFTPEKGKISLTVEKVSDNDNTCVIRVTVKDTGIGISEEGQKQLFKAFVQIDGKYSRKYGGTGLGLAISKRIVEMLHGSIRVESEINKGSSFIFEIPVEKVSADKEYPEKAASGESGRSEDGIFSNKKILIVEDVELNCEILIALLEHTGVQIDTASDGAVAIEKFAGNPNAYDLIFMDIHMPQIDGYEATKRIRNSGLPGAETIPIIAMTANVFQEDIDRCLGCGMNSHLGKPINIDEIIEKLKEYLLKP